MPSITLIPPQIPPQILPVLLLLQTPLSDVGHLFRDGRCRPATDDRSS